MWMQKLTCSSSHICWLVPSVPPGAAADEVGAGAEVVTLIVEEGAGVAVGLGAPGRDALKVNTGSLADSDEEGAGASVGCGASEEVGADDAGASDADVTVGSVETDDSGSVGAGASEVADASGAEVMDASGAEVADSSGAEVTVASGAEVKVTSAALLDGRMSDDGSSPYVRVIVVCLPSYQFQHYKPNRGTQRICSRENVGDRAGRALPLALPLAVCLRPPLLPLVVGDLALVLAPPGVAVLATPGGCGKSSGGRDGGDGEVDESDADHFLRFKESVQMKTKVG